MYNGFIQGRLNMRVKKYINKGKGKYQVFFDNDEILDTYEEVIIKYHLFEDKEIDKMLYKDIIKDTSLQEKINDCLKYIKVRLRSEKEIRNYLLKKKTSLDDIDLIISKLLRSNLLNDDLFCRCFINDKLKLTSMGDYKIKQELKKYGIADEIVLKYEYLFDKQLLEQKMDKLINKYLKSSKNKNINYLKNKIYSNLMTQGYDVEMIMSKLDNLSE